MANLAMGPVAQEIGALFEGGSVAGLIDRQLLERFNFRRDAVGEAAFAALVARHGPMVLGVCRHVLADRHLAEDGFQATFLVLARKARAIRDSDRLGNWLYGVAFRTLRCARIAARSPTQERGDPALRYARARMSRSSRRSRQPKGQSSPASRSRGQLERRDPRGCTSPFRLPIVLCYLDGLTVHEAGSGSSSGRTVRFAVAWHGRARS